MIVYKYSLYFFYPFDYLVLYLFIYFEVFDCDFFTAISSMGCFLSFISIRSILFVIHLFYF